MTVAAALRSGAKSLIRSDSAKLDAEILLGFVLNLSRAQLLIRAEQTLPPALEQRFFHLIGQRQVGKPIAYLTGQKEFWSFALTVNEHTLIPRPETECLVEQSLETIGRYGYNTILDLGTGSGAIALAIASENRQCQLTATDISDQAIEVARRNAERLRLFNIHFHSGNWFEPLGEQRFDIIVANPPYLAANDKHLLDLSFEPQSALVSGEDGLDALRSIVFGAPTYLANNGCLMVEHGFDQADKVTALFIETGFERIVIHKDYAGNDRVTSGFWPR